MNLKLSLPTSLKPYLKLLARSRSAFVGLVLISVFGFTAYIVNTATNVKSDGTSDTKADRILFDKTAIKSVKSRDQVPDQTALGALGKSDPFSR